MKKLRKYVSLLLISLFCLAVGFAAGIYYASPVIEQSLEESEPMFMPEDMNDYAGKHREKARKAMAGAPMMAGGYQVAVTRKLIREAELALKVQNVPKAVQQVKKVAEQLDGYVAHTSQSRSSEGT